MAKTFDLSVIFRVMNKASKPLRDIGKSLKNLTKPVDRANKAFQKLGKSIQKTGQKMEQVGRNLVLKLTLPLAVLGGLAARAAIQFESAFTGVRKTVEATEPQFQALKKGMEALALKVPLATQEIFRIGEAAGQLGIKQEDLLQFTKVMADLGATTNMSAEEAATSLARFANVVGVSSKDFDRLGSSIVDLGNNMAANEQEIVMMGGRLAKAGVFAGLSADQIMGFAAALTSVGINAEAGGTAFSQVMMRIGKEVGTGSEKMQGFAWVAGKSVKEFEKLWKKDAAEALLLFTEGLKRTEKQGVNVNQVLDALGLDGIRVASSLLAAAASGDKFRGALDRSSKAWKENNALTKEANLRYKTAESRLIIFKNRVVQLGVAFGKILVQALVPFLESLSPLINFLKNLSPTVKVLILVFAGLAATIGPLLIAFGFIVSSVGAIMAIFTPAVLTIGLVASGIGAVVAALIGLSALIAVVMTNWRELITIWQDWSKFVVQTTEILARFGEDIFNLLISPITFLMDKLVELTTFLSGGGIFSKIAKGLGFKIDASGSPGVSGVPGLPGSPGVSGVPGLPGSPGVSGVGAESLIKATGTKAKGQATAKALTEANIKSETDINIKVTSDRGSTATIEKVKSKGPNRPNLNTMAQVGAF